MSTLQYQYAESLPAQTLPSGVSTLLPLPYNGSLYAMVWMATGEIQRNGTVAPEITLYDSGAALSYSYWLHPADADSADWVPFVVIYSLLPDIGNATKSLSINTGSTTVKVRNLRHTLWCPDNPVGGIFGANASLASTTSGTYTINASSFIPAGDYLMLGGLTNTYRSAGTGDLTVSLSSYNFTTTVNTVLAANTMTVTSNYRTSWFAGEKITVTTGAIHSSRLVVSTPSSSTYSDITAAVFIIPLNTASNNVDKATTPTISSTTKTLHDSFITQRKRTLFGLGFQQIRATSTTDKLKTTLETPFSVLSEVSVVGPTTGNVSTNNRRFGAIVNTQTANTSTYVVNGSGSGSSGSIQSSTLWTVNQNQVIQNTGNKIVPNVTQTTATVNWGTPLSNVTAYNTTTFSSMIPQSTTANNAYLNLIDFDFSYLPSNATIVSINPNIMRNISNGTTGAISGTMNMIVNGTPDAGSTTIAAAGSSGAVQGLVPIATPVGFTATLAQLRANQIGYRLRFTNTGNRNIYIFYALMSIIYTLDTGPMSGTHFQAWSGSTWQGGELKLWNGTSWVGAITQKWSGTSWDDVS